MIARRGSEMSVLRKATPERLSALSEGVFAVLITVLVLELRRPAQPTFKAFLLLWSTWLSYAVSYLYMPCLPSPPSAASAGTRPMKCQAAAFDPAGRVGAKALRIDRWR